MSSAISFSWGVSQSGFNPAALKRVQGGGMGLSTPKLAESSPKLAESSAKLAESSPKLAEASPKLAESSPKLAESGSLGGRIDVTG